MPHITAAEGEAVEDGAGAEQEVIIILSNNIDNNYYHYQLELSRR